MNTYAGIGSRRTPLDVITLMRRLATQLATDGWVLRSGHAQGADQAFERGAADGSGDSEIFLPWDSFENEITVVGRRFSKPLPEAFRIAAEAHPYWASLRDGAKRLHARNTHQVLGPELDDPSRFVLCWTPDGSLDGCGVNTGGTGQALRLADRNQIPVFNLQRDDHRSDAESWLSSRSLRTV